MKFVDTPLEGPRIIEVEPFEDERGTFQRAWCRREFESHGIAAEPAQVNLSTNHRSGTLRGLHLQLPPNAESKLVRCTRGAIWDVAVDMRPASPTFLQHIGVRLSAENRRALFVPELFAHGYLTLEPDTDVFYQVSAFHAPGYERGFRWNDPLLEIDWPREIDVLSEKDAAWPDIDPDGVARELRQALSRDGADT